MPRKKKACRFCYEKKEVDYKDYSTLERFLTKHGRLYSRKRSGNCAQHQRDLGTAIKRARYMALVPYTLRGKRRGM